MTKLITFDAVGTLIYLPKSVGYHYALVGQRIGLRLEAHALDRAFAEAWKETPSRPATSQPREDDDKGWWRELVERVLAKVAPNSRELDRAAFFEAAYAHFAEAGVWETYPEVVSVLEQLRTRAQLAVISNFDGRLRPILQTLGLSQYFAAVTVSSEVGADKPHLLIFQHALTLAGVLPNETLHVGDDPMRDWEGAAAAGLKAFRLKRPNNSLRDLLPLLSAPAS